MRMLDERDPVGAGLPACDAETVAELHALHPEMAWCPDLLCTVLPTPYDSYRTSPGDGEVAARAVALNEARRLWALDRAARAHGADKAEERAALAMAKDAVASSNASRLGGVVRLFRQLHAVRASELDVEPTALGTPHGVLDMDSGELCAADGNDGRAFMVTRCTGADVDGGGEGGPSYDARWDEFVLEIMDGDAERAAYLQRALGYSCLGGNPEECMFVAYGATTRNGKDTLLESVKTALGDYAAAAERTFLSRRRAEGGTDEALASLAGRRLVTLSEPPRGMPLDEGKVKDLTACGTQSTSKKFGAQFEFRPQFTIWMNVNNLPEVGDDSVFEGGRIRVVPFERHFAPHERDTTLKARFASDDGRYTVLRWLLDGYAAYRERGLDEPEAVRRATADYAETGGTTVDKFVRRCCLLRAGARCENNSLKEAYAAFCEGVLGEPPATARALAAELARYGVSKHRSHGTDWWRGVELDVSAEAEEALRSCTRDAPELAPEGVRGDDSDVGIARKRVRIS
jgi:P4 family phage/plasmid primase-like protien